MLSARCWSVGTSRRFTPASLHPPYRQGMSPALYHEGNRALQDRFDSRRIADRLEEITVHDRFWDGDRAFIETCSMFFLATADADGWPDCSYKGGMPGFVKVVDD